MEHVCKLVRVVSCCLILFCTLICRGQNVYNLETEYYNMDTSWHKDNESLLLLDEISRQHQSNLGTDCRYCYLKKKLELSVLTLNDSRILQLVDSVLNEALKCRPLYSPEYYGFFVELELFHNDVDTSVVTIDIRVKSNYDMHWAFANWRDEILYEWYGHYEKNVLGCFFRNNILCVVTAQGGRDFESASCLYTYGQSSITLSIYAPVKPLVTRYRWPNADYLFPKCRSTPIGR